MDEQLLNSLADELQKEFNDLAKLEPGSKEYESHVQNIERLWKLADKEVELAREDDETMYRREQDAIKSQKEAKDKIIDRAITIGTKIVEISVPTYVYWKLFGKTMKFEETNVWSTTGGKNLLGKIPNPFRR